MTDGLFSCTLVRVASYDNWDYGANVHHMVGIQVMVTPLDRVSGVLLIKLLVRDGGTARLYH